MESYERAEVQFTSTLGDWQPAPRGELFHPLVQTGSIPVGARLGKWKTVKRANGTVAKNGERIPVGAKWEKWKTAKQANGTVTKEGE